MSIIRPTSDITTTGWTPSSGGVLFDMVDETSPNDSDYITGPAVGQGITYYLLFGISTVPAGTYSIRVRAKGTNDTCELRVSLLDSSNVVQGVSSWQLVDTVFTTYTFSVTSTGSATRIKLETTSSPGQIVLDGEIVGLNSSFIALLPEGPLWLEESQFLLENDAISFV